MRIVIAAVMPRRQGLRLGPARDLFQAYVDRIASFGAVDVQFPDTESVLLERLRREGGRVPPYMVLLESRGKPATSESLAARFGDIRDRGTQQVVFAIGPADGWSEGPRKAAHWLLSLGPMTLPHELALIVLAEQIYRAHTILAGHPYHSAH